MKIVSNITWEGSKKTSKILIGRVYLRCKIIFTNCLKKTDSLVCGSYNLDDLVTI